MDIAIASTRFSTMKAMIVWAMLLPEITSITKNSNTSVVISSITLFLLIQISAARAENGYIVYQGIILPCCTRLPINPFVIHNLSFLVPGHISDRAVFFLLSDDGQLTTRSSGFDFGFGSDGYCCGIPIIKQLINNFICQIFALFFFHDILHKF